MSWRVLATPRSFFEEGREGYKLLETAGVEVIPSPADRPLQDEELAALLGQVDGLVVGVDRVGRRSLQAGR
ncbi:MAG: hydroxyacid dehydrogenase, partial [candidate division GAL15 bacterium]